MSINVIQQYLKEGREIEVTERNGDGTVMTAYEHPNSINSSRMTSVSVPKDNKKFVVIGMRKKIKSTEFLK